MKFSKLIITAIFAIYATSIFAFQLSPDSGVSQFVGSIFGEHFATLNAYSAMVTLFAGGISGMISNLPGWVKLISAVVIAIAGALAGWFFALGIFIDTTMIEAIKVGWTVAGGSTLIHSMIKQAGLINIIKSYFSK